MKRSKVFCILVTCIMSLSLFSACSSNTNESINEAENNEIVTFPLKFYSVALSSVTGLPIELNLEGATFYCKTEKGSFSYDTNIKEYNVNSGETLYYCPVYIENDIASCVEGNDYVDIIIQENEEVIGFSVVKIIYNSSFKWNYELIASNLFVNQNGESINVTEEYVNERIKENHK